MAHTCRYMLSPTVSTSLGSLEVTSESSPRYGGRSWTARSPPTGPDHSRSRDGSWSGSACSAVGEIGRASCRERVWVSGVDGRRRDEKTGGSAPQKYVYH